MSNDTRSRPMTTETIHTCSYSCERPGCIRAQRDELAARLTAPSPPHPRVRPWGWRGATTRARTSSSMA
jgi:hypothetical protein